MGERIKEVRLYCKLTQTEFANRLGFTQANLSRCEKDLQTISEPLIKAICREFKVNEIWLRTGQGEMFVEVSIDDKLATLLGDEFYKEDTYMKELIINLLEMDESQRELFKDFVKRLSGKSNDINRKEVD